MGPYTLPAQHARRQQRRRGEGNRGARHRGEQRPTPHQQQASKHTHTDTFCCPVQGPSVRERETSLLPPTVTITSLRALYFILQHRTPSIGAGAGAAAKMPSSAVATATALSGPSKTTATQRVRLIHPHLLAKHDSESSLWVSYKVCTVQERKAGFAPAQLAGSSSTPDRWPLHTQQEC